MVNVMVSMETRLFLLLVTDTKVTQQAYSRDFMTGKNQCNTHEKGTKGNQISAYYHHLL